MKSLHMLLAEAEFKGTTLGISRDLMPQVEQKNIEDFKKYLKDQGIIIRQVAFAVSQLYPTQRDYSEDKVKHMLDTMTLAEVTKTVFLVSADRFIADGHHRYIVAKIIDPMVEVNCLQVNIPIVEFLKVIEAYPKVFKKTLEEDEAGSPTSSDSAIPHAKSPNASGERKKDIIGENQDPIKSLFANMWKG